MIKNALFHLRRIFLTPLGSRISVRDRRRVRGMAMFLVMISLAIMTSVVSDLSYNETIRYKLALHQRDALKAEALAVGGLNIARLMLIIQGKIQPYISTFAGMGVPLPHYTIWELLPIEGEMLKGLVTGDLAASLGLDVSESLKKRTDKRIEKKERKFKTTFEEPEGAFGAFEGSFDVEISDEEGKISLRNWATVTDAKKRVATKRLLAALMSPLRYDELFGGRASIGVRVDRPSLIANIFDYIDIDETRVDPYALDADWGRAGGGAERDGYALDKGVLPKNAYFDSAEELRLVHGMGEGQMDAFADAITIYGSDEGKINILSAKDKVLEAVTRYCAQSELDPLLLNPSWIDETLKGWRSYEHAGLGPVSPDGFVGYLKTRGINLNAEACKSILDVKSANFTLTSKANVNGVKWTLTLVARVVSNAEEIYYFKNN